MDALNAVAKAVSRARVPVSRELVHLRAGQINGCSVCVDMHAKGARRSGESEERVFAVAAWRETPYFSDAERAALALTEALTRLADRPDRVPDDIWDAAAAHFDEPQLGALVLDIALVNVWNRLNVATQRWSASTGADAAHRAPAATPGRRGARGSVRTRCARWRRGPPARWRGVRSSERSRRPPPGAEAERRLRSRTYSAVTPAATRADRVGFVGVAFIGRPPDRRGRGQGGAGGRRPRRRPRGRGRSGPSRR